MYAYPLSTAVIFVAELGDKSQLMAMTCAARYRVRDVLIGITAATALVHLASVGIGYFIGDAFADQQRWISIVGGVAFLAELGDKTMLATITLATQEGWLGTWIGSTVGMVVADALAIVVGAMLGKKLPENAIRYGVAALFALFGIILIVDGLLT